MADLSHLFKLVSSCQWFSIQLLCHVQMERCAIIQTGRGVPAFVPVAIGTKVDARSILGPLNFRLYG